MMLRAFDIPDDPAALPAWLERQLVGLHLAEVVAELAAVQQAAPGGPSVQGLLGNRLPGVLAAGLGTLPASVLRQFLCHPTLLLELQELILVGGGPYWDRLAAAEAGTAELARRGRQRLPQLWGTPAETVLSLRGPRLPWYRRPVLVSLATAAVVLVAVLGTQRLAPGPNGTAWAWNRPGVFRQDLPAPLYLEHLANAASDWFQQRPEEALPLARRLAAFREGCSVLILSEHAPLPPEDRQWLVSRCRDWAGKLDRHLAALEAGGDPVQVRAEADATIDKLIQALRSRAKERASQT